MKLISIFPQWPVFSPLKTNVQFTVHLLDLQSKCYKYRGAQEVLYLLAIDVITPHKTKKFLTNINAITWLGLWGQSWFRNLLQSKSRLMSFASAGSLTCRSNSLVSSSYCKNTVTWGTIYINHMNMYIHVLWSSIPTK